MSHKVALVTGANRGIGQAIAKEIASQEVFVIGTSTTEAGAESITREFKEANLNGYGKVLNITDQTAIKNLIQEI